MERNDDRLRHTPHIAHYLRGKRWAVLIALFVNCHGGSNQENMAKNIPDATGIFFLLSGEHEEDFRNRNVEEFFSSRQSSRG